ncbi:hypothetical protein F5Y12DRAFT_731114 [Xylaria sp. FL1777]|nr:hypothetical protein F5Y12DRAFT_731114 [Xylaria sp. FL1777]
MEKAKDDKMREAEESMDVVGRLRGEEKSSRKHSRGKKEPLSYSFGDTLGVEANDCGGDEPELVPEEVMSEEEGFETSSSAENMVTEHYAPEEAPQDEPPAASYSSRELDGHPTDAAIQEANFGNNFATDSDPGTGGILVAHTKHDTSSDALALSPTDNESRFHDITQHPNAKEDEARDLQRVEDLGCLKNMEPEIETTPNRTLGLIPLGIEDRAVNSNSPEVETALVAPYEEMELQPVELSGTLDGPYLDLELPMVHDDPKLLEETLPEGGFTEDDHSNVFGPSEMDDVGLNAAPIPEIVDMTTTRNSEAITAEHDLRIGISAPAGMDHAENPSSVGNSVIIEVPADQRPDTAHAESLQHPRQIDEASKLTSTDTISEDIALRVALMPKTDEDPPARELDPSGEVTRAVLIQQGPEYSIRQPETWTGTTETTGNTLRSLEEESLVIPNIGVTQTTDIAEDHTSMMEASVTAADPVVAGKSHESTESVASSSPEIPKQDPALEELPKATPTTNERPCGKEDYVVTYTLEPTEEVMVEKGDSHSWDSAVNDEPLRAESPDTVKTTHAAENSSLSDEFASEDDAISKVKPSTLDESSANERLITYGAADIELPPSPSLSQVDIDTDPATLNTSVVANALLKKYAASVESSDKETSLLTHELYHIQDRTDEPTMNYARQTSPGNRPFVIDNAGNAPMTAESIFIPAETSAWETVDEDETSEQAWETTDDDETMEKSWGDFRLPREQHTLSDISEVAQELSEVPHDTIRIVNQDVPRDITPAEDLSRHDSGPVFDHAKEPNPKSPEGEISRNTLRSESLDVLHQQSSPYQPMLIETHGDEKGSSDYVVEWVPEVAPPNFMRDEGIHGSQSTKAVDENKPQQQFGFEDWAAWGDSEFAAGSLPENLAFHPHSLDTISEDSDDEFTVKKLGDTKFVNEPEPLQSPIPSQLATSFLKETPLEDVFHETPVEQFVVSVGSLNEAQASSSTRSPARTAILGETHVVAGNKLPGWPATLEEDEDDSEVEIQILPHVFDYGRFISETSAVSHFREAGNLSFDAESEEVKVLSQTPGHNIRHSSQRFSRTQGGIEVDQHSSQDDPNWPSTRSSPIDEPLLDDERLGTIDDTFAPTKARSTGQVQGQALENASVLDLGLGSINSSEAHNASIAFDLHSFQQVEASTEGHNRGQGFRLEPMTSGSFSSLEPIFSGVDLLDHPSFERRPIPPKSNRRQHQPILVHSSTQTDEDLPRGFSSLSHYRLAEEPRSPTPAIVLPDLNDPKVKALGRAKSLKKKRRQHFREVEETVATAVVIYATAQELSPPPSPPRSYRQINKNITETLGAQGPVQVSSDVVSSGISAEHSVDENDFSPTVADLSTDDERPHRHRSHRSHHHSSRSRDSVSGDEHRHHRHRHHRSKDDSGQSLKTSSDRSISSRHDREEPLRRHKEESRRQEGGHESSHGSSHRRHRTPEDQAAHDKRKEERRARHELERARERQEPEREHKGKEAETTLPSSDSHSSRSLRRSGQADLRSGHSRPERRVSIKDEPSPVSSKKFFDFRGGESILDPARVAREAETEAPKRTSTSKSHSRPHQESDDAPRTHRTHRESREHREPREHREHREHKEHREHREHRESSDAPRPKSSRHHDEVREDSSKRHRERSSRAKVDDDPTVSARSMPASEGRISTRSRADSDARISTRSRGDSDGRPSTSSHKPRSSNSKDEHPRHGSRREERQKERDAEKKKKEAPSGAFKSMFKKLFT